MQRLSDANEAMTSPTLKKLHQARIAEFEKAFADVLTTHETFRSKLEKSRKTHDENKRMWDIVEHLQPASFELRDAVDTTELMVADDMWPLPKYREILLAHNLT